ncbi:hypothetical protein [Sphingobacterium ginsenosidimutans]
MGKKHLVNLYHPEFSDRPNNWEFQIFFYFIQNLSLSFDEKLNKIEFSIVAFFDQGIYNTKDKIEAIDFGVEHLNRAVFTCTNKIKLIGLADHLGFVFSKSLRTFK